MKRWVGGITLIIIFFSWMSAENLWTADAAEAFLEGYSAFQSGEKFEREGNFAEALKQFRYASNVLEHIARESANWQPMVVTYRLEKIREAIDRVQDAMGAAPDPVSRETIAEGGPLPVANVSMGDVSERQPAAEPATASMRARGQESIGVQERVPAQGGAGLSETTTFLPHQSQQAVAAKGEMGHENSDLRQQLAQRMAELKNALHEVDRTRVTVVELRHELANAKTQLRNLIEDKKVGKDVETYYKDQITDLEKQVLETEADRDVLIEENARLIAKLNRAVAYIAASDSIRQELDNQRHAFAKERTAMSQELEAQKKALADERNVMTQELEKQQQAFTQERSAIEGVRDKISEELATALKELEKSREQIKEIELLTQENEVLKNRLLEDEAKLTQLQNASERERTKQQAIEQEKTLLEQGLTKAHEEMATLETIAEQRDQEIATLRSELKAVNGRLDNLRSDVNLRDNRIVDLERQLDEAAADLAKLRAKGPLSDDDKKVTAENELLRGIILRHLREQARRDQARRLIEEEISRLKIKSETINQQLVAISRPVELSAEEKAVFRIPNVMVDGGDREEPGVGPTLEKEREAPNKQAKLSNDGSSNGSDGKGKGPVKSPGYEALSKQVQEIVDHARAAYNRADLKEAERLYQEAVNGAPDSYFARGQLAAVQFEEGKVQVAEATASRAIELNPEDAFAYAIHGIACYRQSRFADAEKSLRKAIELKPNDPRAHNYLGIVLSELGKSEDAEKAIQKALVLDPKYAEAHFNLAVIYATQTPPSKELAKRHYTAATELGAERDPSLEQLIQ